MIVLIHSANKCEKTVSKVVCFTFIKMHIIQIPAKENCSVSSQSSGICVYQSGIKFRSSTIRITNKSTAYMDFSKRFFQYRFETFGKCMLKR